MTNISEELLSAWLRISTSINNSRVVAELSFNETLVCNVLYRRTVEQKGTRPTATELCSETKILKSQMNRTLNLLEAKRMITRERSDTDRRQVLISLNLENLAPYETQHQRILQLLDHIIAELGTDSIADIINIFNRVSDVADQVLSPGSPDDTSV